MRVAYDGVRGFAHLACSCLEAIVAGRVLFALLGVLVVYAVIKHPVLSAAFAGNCWDNTKGFFAAIGEFFDTLISS